MFQLTIAQKIAIALTIYGVGVATPLYYRMRNPLPIPECRPTVQNTSISHSETRGKKKGKVTTQTTIQSNGTRHEAKIEEFDIDVISNENKKETSTVSLPPAKNPLHRYTIGVGYNYWTSNINIDLGVRIGNTPIYIFGYTDLLHLDRETKSLTVKTPENVVGIGLRVEF